METNFFLSFPHCVFLIQAPSVDWIRVMENLDHEGFYIPNEESFSFFMSVYRRACQVLFALLGVF